MRGMYGNEHHEFRAFAEEQFALNYLDAAANPEFDYLRDPETGEILYHADGSPRVYKKSPIEQMAPGMLAYGRAIMMIKALLLIAGFLFAIAVMAIPGLRDMTRNSDGIATLLLWAVGIAAVGALILAGAYARNKAQLRQLDADIKALED
jgi:hypothetical protein